PDFCWLTLGQIHQLLRRDNLINMEARNVLSCVRYPPRAADVPGRTPRAAGAGRPAFAQDVLLSATSDESECENSLDSILSWLAHLKSTYTLEVYRVPLNRTEGWRVERESIRHETGRFFRIIAVATAIGNREVRAWRQPLVESLPGGILCFLCQKRAGLM